MGLSSYNIGLLALALLAFVFLMQTASVFFWCWNCLSIKYQKTLSAKGTARTVQCPHCRVEKRYQFSLLRALLYPFIALRAPFSTSIWIRSGDRNPQETANQENYGCLLFAIIVGAIAGGLFGLNLAGPRMPAIGGIVGALVGSALVGFLALRSKAPGS